MEKWYIAAGIVLLVIATVAVLTQSTKTDEPADGCECEKIRNLYGVNYATQETYRRLVGQIQEGGEDAETSAYHLFQMVRRVRNHPACYVARGDEALKVAFCSVWPDVETKAREQGW